MNKALLAAGTAAMLVLGAAPASAQSFDTRASVIQECGRVVTEEAAAPNTFDHPLRGHCVDATGAYLKALVSTSPSIEALGADIALLVADLADLLRPHECKFESEVLQAMGMAAATAEDPDQAVRIERIAVTLRECDTGATAAIGGPEIGIDIIDYPDAPSGPPASAS